MKAHGTIGSIVPSIPNFRARQRWVVSFINQLLLYSWRKNSRYPLNGRLGGSQNKSGHRRWVSGGTEHPICQSFSQTPSFILTELFSLLEKQRAKNGSSVKRTCTQVVIWHALHAFKKKIMHVCRTMVITTSGHLAII